MCCISMNSLCKINKLPKINNTYVTEKKMSFPGILKFGTATSQLMHYYNINIKL